VHQLTDRAWAHIYQLAWAGADGVLMLAKDKEDGFQIWQVSYPDGMAKRLTNDPEGYFSLSVTKDGGTITVAKAVLQSNIWVAPSNDVNSAHMLTGGASKLDTFAAWAGNRLFFFSQTTIMGADTPELWSMDPNGGNRTAVSIPVNEIGDLSASQDGRCLTFTASTGDANNPVYRHMYRVNVDGSDLREITTDGGYVPSGPRFSKDGQWLYYVANQQGKPPSIWKIRSDGTGGPVHLSEEHAYALSLSPDGKYLAFMTDGEDPKNNRVGVSAADGSGTVKYFSNIINRFTWAPDSRSLSYVVGSADRVDNLMSQAISGGEPKKLTDFKSLRLWSFEYSSDGKQIAFSQGIETSDVLLYTNFK
jgi:Tol biopolymer transport system component